LKNNGTFTPFPLATRLSRFPHRKESSTNIKQYFLMFKKFSLTDKLLFISASLSLVYSEILFFNGNTNEAIFVGIWVPSILAFGIYLKLINKND
jgi:hypothetical protein